ALPVPAGGGLWQPARARAAATAANLSNSPLLRGGQEIAERAELRRLGDAGAVLVVRRFLGVLAEGAQRKLRFAAARIDLEDLGFEPHAGREVLAQIGAALGAGVAGGNEPARLPARGADDANDEAGRLGDDDGDLHHLVRRDALPR